MIFHSRNHGDNFFAVFTVSENDIWSLVQDIEDFQRIGNGTQHTFVILNVNLLENIWKFEQQKILIDFNKVPWEAMKIYDAG